MLLKSPFKFLTFLAATSVSFVVATSAQSISVVQWGPEDDIVTGFSNTNRNVVQVDLATAFNPDIGTHGYYQGGNPGNASAIFYGTVYNSTDGDSRLQIPNSITPNPLTFDFSNGTDTSATREIAGLALWQKSDGFLTSNTISFADLSLSLDHSVNGSTARGEVRFVVREGAGDFFISNDLGTLSAANAGVANESMVSSWFSFDPTVSVLDVGAVATPTLSDITAIGFSYYKQDQFTNATFRVSEFSATAIPEPSTYAAILGFGALALVVWRRRLVCLKKDTNQ